jgi:hypothetical protein
MLLRQSRIPILPIRARMAVLIGVLAASLAMGVARAARRSDQMPQEPERPETWGGIGLDAEIGSQVRRRSPYTGWSAAGRALRVCCVTVLVRCLDWLPGAVI